MIRHLEEAALEVRFPSERFPHIWLFLPLGGWRGHQLALVEAASGYPMDLADAVEMGTHSVIPGWGQVQAEITYTVIRYDSAIGVKSTC